MVRAEKDLEKQSPPTWLIGGLCFLDSQNGYPGAWD